nr:MAG TPA: hypothetical protein [Caudoviricetes sp.]
MNRGENKSIPMTITDIAKVIVGLFILYLPTTRLII